MNTVIRIAAAVNAVEPGNPHKCFHHAQEVLHETFALNPDTVIFPSDFLTGVSCGDLGGNRAVTQAVDNGYAELLTSGSPVVFCPDNDPVYFSIGGYRCAAVPVSPDDMFTVIPAFVSEGIRTVILCSCTPVSAGKIEDWRTGAKLLSKSLSCAVVIINGGTGESSSPYIYKGFAGIYECGRELAAEESFCKGFSVCADIDMDIIGDEPCCCDDRLFPIKEKSELMRPIEKNPYLPPEKEASDKFLDELFTLQASSLAIRMQKTGIKKAVIGVSGGLDSTLALLVAANALKMLELPEQNLIGISMPGFGTTDRTYNNSLALIESLGADAREIPIKDAVTVHFKDIGHDVNMHDVTYENAQARERCQILFDVANTQNGIVVGTGDLTEEALGWCTFGGDHLAAYNVNTSITKTMARMMVRRLVENKSFPLSSDILIDILDTPVSPELLPPDENGGMTQQSEKILGPYELHEFFTFYLVRYQMAPSKILRYAVEAFDTDYQPEYIRQMLVLFLKRHFAGQFKRACSPDCADIGELSLTPAAYSIASDLSCDFLLQELKKNADF